MVHQGCHDSRRRHATSTREQARFTLFAEQGLPALHRGVSGCQITGDANVDGDAVDIAAIFYAGPPKVPQLFYIGFLLNDGPDPGVVKYSWFDSQGTMVPRADCQTNAAARPAMRKSSPSAMRRQLRAWTRDEPMRSSQSWAAF